MCYYKPRNRVYNHALKLHTALVINSAISCSCYNAQCDGDGEVPSAQPREGGFTCGGGREAYFGQSRSTGLGWGGWWRAVRCWRWVQKAAFWHLDSFTQWVSWRRKHVNGVRGGSFLQLVPHLLQWGPEKGRNGPLVALWCLLLPSALFGNLKTYLFTVMVWSEASMHYTGHLAVGDKDVPVNTHRKTLKIAGSVPGQTDEVNLQAWGKY